MVINNYTKYLDQKYLKLLKNKMDLIDEKLRSKIKIDINNISFMDFEPEMEEAKKGRKR